VLDLRRQADDMGGVCGSEGVTPWVGLEFSRWISFLRLGN
jgi:hypothetical protein